MGNSCCSVDCLYDPTGDRIDAYNNSYPNAALSTSNNIRGGNYAKSVTTETTRYDGGICEGDLSASHGIIRYLNGDVYLGEWRNGRAYGKGKIVRIDGTIFEGEMKNDIAEGHGKEIIKMKDLEGIFEGEFKNGLKHGQGSFYFSNGTCYIGQFHENYFHGFGKYQFSDNRIYIGQWNKNQYHGWGLMLWNEGKYYEGQFVNDVKNGIGTFSWSDHRKYIGEWLNGKQNGKGIFISSNDVCRGAIWENGQRRQWLTEPLIKKNLLSLINELHLNISRPNDLPLQYYQQLCVALKLKNIQQIESDITVPYSLYFKKKNDEKIRSKNIESHTTHHNSHRYLKSNSSSSSYTSSNIDSKSDILLNDKKNNKVSFNISKGSKSKR